MTLFKLFRMASVRIYFAQPNRRVFKPTALYILRFANCTLIAGACDGGLAVLTGSSGVLSLRGTQYTDNDICQWKIEVNEGQVRHCRTYVRCVFL